MSQRGFGWNVLRLEVPDIFVLFACILRIGSMHIYIFTHLWYIYLLNGNSPMDSMGT